MKTLRLDRSAFKAQTATEAAQHAQYYQSMSWQGRLAVAAYLNSIAYNYPVENPPKMDKTLFKARARTQQ